MARKTKTVQVVIQLQHMYSKASNTAQYKVKFRACSLCCQKRPYQILALPKFW